MTNPLTSPRTPAVVGALLLILAACEKDELPSKSKPKVWPEPLAGLAAQLSQSLPTTGCDEPCACLGDLAKNALDQGLHKEVIETCGKLEEPCRSSPEALGVRAEALARQGRWSESESAAEEATRSPGPRPFAHYALALGALNRMTMKEAEQATQRAESDGRGPEVHRAFGQIALARGQFQKCAEHFEKLEQAFPTDTEASLNRAVCETNADHYKNAREAFLKTLRLDPKNKQARLMLVQLTGDIGAWDEAAHHLDAFAKLAPDDPRLPQLREAIETRGESIKKFQELQRTGQALPAPIAPTLPSSAKPKD